MAEKFTTTTTLGSAPQRDSAGKRLHRRCAEVGQAQRITFPILPTVGYAITRYLTSPGYAELSTGTQDDYGFALDKLTENFGTAPLDQVKPAHLTLYLEKRSRTATSGRDRSIGHSAKSRSSAWCFATLEASG